MNEQQLYYYTRINDYNVGQNTMDIKPGDNVHGGGMNAKALYVSEAVEVILCDNLEQGNLFLIDPLAIYQNNDKLQEIVDSKATKILWCEESELLRWRYSQRKTLCDNVDAVAVCNEYFQNILMEYDIKSSILRTPIDVQMYKPTTKKPQLLIVGQASYCKGTDTIIKVLDALPKEIEPVFIGSAALWGHVGRQADIELESRLGSVCRHIPSASHKEVANLMNESWGYLCMSKYDVGALAMLEAGMSGCECFIWNRHRFADSYPIHRVPSDVDGCVEYITNQFQSFDGVANYAMRSFVKSRHSYESFRSQLETLVSDVIKPSDDNLLHIKVVQ